MKKALPYLLLLPVLAVWMLTRAVPLGIAVRLSFIKTNYITETYVYFKNYQQIFTDPSIVQTFKNTLLYMITIVPAYMCFVLFMAFLINDLNKKVQHVARFFVFLPTFVSGIIIANSWKWIFHPRAGLINWLLGLGGIEPVQWWSSTVTSVFPISFIHVLSVGGGTIILFLAALGGIDTQIIESAKIDGASRWQIKRFIQLPMISPTIALMSLMCTISTLQIFEWIYMLAPRDYAATMMYRIYHDGFLYGKPGLAAAESMVLLAIILVLAVAQKRLQKWQF